MADSPSPQPTTDSKSDKPEVDEPKANTQPDPAPTSTTSSLPPPPSPLPPQLQQPQASTPNPNSTLVSPSPQPASSYVSTPITGPVAAVVPPAPPSFRPVPQYPHIPNPNFGNVQVHGVQPPGVSAVPMMTPGAPTAGFVTTTMPVPPHMLQYQVQVGQVPNAVMRPYLPMPNGYAAMPGSIPQGAMPPPGLVRYPSPYPTMIRPAFNPRPPGAIGVLPALYRPPVPLISGVRPLMPLRPAMLPTVTPAEKPQTTVYVGKIPPTVENDFMLSLLQFCGPVKSWKRAQNPTNGTPGGFGFCEFESPEGVLRALRLLSKFSFDGQDLLLNVDQATREYLGKYVEKKMENAKKPEETQPEGSEKEETAAGDEKSEPAKPTTEEPKKDKDNIEIANSAVVTDEDKEADRDALEKLKEKIEERLRSRPPPPPPVLGPPDASGNSNSEAVAKSKEGDSDVDTTRRGGTEDKNDDETSSEHNRPETSSPDRSRRHDRRSRDRDRDRDRERDIKREKEHEIERYEREAERERARKEREQRRKIEDAERAYQVRLKQWERREREREKERQYEKEREKEKDRKRRKDILYEEDDDEDDSRKRWHRSTLEDKRKRRQWEKEDDLTDRLKEEEEIAEAKRKAEEEKLHQQQMDALRILSGHAIEGSEKAIEPTVENNKDEVHDNDTDLVHENNVPGDGLVQNGTDDESAMEVITASDASQSGNAPGRKLGFGIVGSGKRTAVPSVFHEEEEDDTQKEKRMRPLVPIDYSTEELQAVQPSNGSGAQPPNLLAAAEFAKRISNVNPKEEKPDLERERGRRSHDKSSRREKDHEDNNRTRDDNKDKIVDRDRDRDRGLEKVKAQDNKKLLDAKQLIDMIPKTKEELFSYEINWTTYDKHELHERMRPWISKKILEFLGEEEPTLVDYIVSSTQEHVKASRMLELLQSILDEEAEMFVLKMWRMLIFEIKRVEVGLPLKSKS